MGIGFLAGGGYFGEQMVVKLTDKMEQGEDNEEEIIADEVADVGETVMVEEDLVEEDLEAIFATAFEEKYNKIAGSAEISINIVEDEHVSGGVKFAGEISGGWFLGAKDEGKWIIVADGNGTVMCSEIEPYNFSAEMVPECWDETTMALVKR